MKSLPVIGLTPPQQCVLQQMINRRGVVTVNDVKIIAEACGIDNTEAMTLANGMSPEGKQINALVNEAVGWQPIIDRGRRAAYAQVIFEDKIERRMAEDLPLSDMDAIQILDYVRKEVDQPGVTNVNINNVDTMFDFSGMTIEQLQGAIGNMQKMIDTGEIVDAEFTELVALTENATGRDGDVAEEAGREVIEIPQE